STNNVTIDGGTLQISQNQTLNNLTLSAGTLIIDAGKTLTINGSYNATGGTITNNGTIIFNSDNNFPGASTTVSACASLEANANITLNNSLTITNSLALNSGTFALNNNLLVLNGAALTSVSGIMTGGTTSDLNLQGTTGGTVILPLASDITLRTINVAGNRVLEMDGVNNINLYGSLTIFSSATYDNGGESQLQNFGGSVIIYGKFITRDTNGFTGTSTAIPSISPVLNSGCTVEFGRAGDQLISIRSDYQNLIFSNGGTKTLASASPITPITGTVTISGSTIVDVANNTFGHSATNFTMTGTSKFITGGSGVKPNMGGDYSLSSGTTIEFSGSSATDVRVSGVSYYNV
ncbi:MAG: hypothetical protein ACK4ON_14375, partial [Bacteroidia bacterium]